ncbi:MAG: hypothetical protein HKN23_09060, partial [Verrucomicrobiales bacterium]|nr:hypothetical protein [Verrucomicrobiales bacterium]
MRFTLTDSQWILDQLHPAEWHFLCELPDISSGKGFSQDVRERLLPGPILPRPGEDADEHKSMLDDWEEFVKPDLELTFQSARKCVELDLQAVEIGDPPEIDPDLTEPDIAEQIAEINWRRLPVPNDHAEEWYST